MTDDEIRVRLIEIDLQSPHALTAWAHAHKLSRYHVRDVVRGDAVPGWYLSNAVRASVERVVTL